MNDLTDVATRQRFVEAVRAAIRSGDRERFDKLMAWAEHQKIPPPSFLDRRRAQLRREAS